VARTFAIGDIHGDLAALDALLARLPALGGEDTLIFLGDYVDRGPDSRGVIERVRRLAADGPARVVALRGNHEDRWIACHAEPDVAFLLPPGNGCANMYLSFAGRPALGEGGALDKDDFLRLLQVSAWLPADVVAWMDGLPLWHEDEHALYVHAGVEGEGTDWKHPRDSARTPLLWMREPAFYKGYQGKTLVFGHSPVVGLPTDHLGRLARLFDDPGDVWTRGDLIGVDTGCGKGGFLSAVELPAMKVYESR